jgi:hypothetical protein
MTVKKTLVGGAVLLLFSTLLLVEFFRLIDMPDPPPEIRLPLLAIGGVLVLLVALALVAGAFTLLNLANPREALGLPEGSVRAVIALSLIVLFATISIYVYTNMDRPPIKQLSGLTEQGKSDLLSKVPSSAIVSSVSNGATGDALRYTVYYRDTNPQADDVGKQLITLIGTLVTSVASFYFGSKSAAPITVATGMKPTGPSVRGVTPSTLARGAGADLEIAGESLDLVKEAKITLGRQQIVASNVTSNASVVKCHLDVPAGVQTGAWTMTVTDGLGQKAELPNSFTVT